MRVGARTFYKALSLLSCSVFYRNHLNLGSAPGTKLFLVPALPLYCFDFLRRDDPQIDFISPRHTRKNIPW
jgi:hypothetical protein